MRIGYDAKYLWQGKKHSAKTGHGVHARELLLQLMELDRHNEYSVYLIEDDLDFSLKENFRPVYFPSLAKSSILRNLLAYPWELRRHPIDLLMTYTAVPWFLRCKTMLFLADIFWIAHPEWLPKKVSWPITLATRVSVQKADVVVTTTQFSKREIMKYLNVPEKKIEIVPHGIRPKFLDPLDRSRVESVKAKYGIRGRYLLSVNDIHPRKNLDHLVQAFCRLKEKEHLDHQLVLVGRTLWDYPSFFKGIENSKFKNDIILPGYVASEDIPALYQGASLFVYPSFYEGWGLQTHEAMSSGIPLAISNSSTLPEVSGDAAISFDPYDIDDMSRAIFKILDNPKLQKELVDKGYEQIKKFSWESAARKTLDICKKIT